MKLGVYFYCQIIDLITLVDCYRYLDFYLLKRINRFFTDTIIAELRGFFYNNNVSPIWNAIGKQFLRMPFNQADQLSVKDPDFLPSKFPKMPIYTHLLDPQATKFLGQVHPNTKPALRLLTSENFSITNQIDIFDGGPILNCNTTDCRTIQQSKTIRLSDLNDHIQHHDSYLVSNQLFANFRATKVTHPINTGELSNLLQISVNDSVFIVKESDV